MWRNIRSRCRDTSKKPLKINVLLRISNMTKTCEVTVFIDGVIVRGVEKSDDMYKSIDLVFDKVERQIHKYKTRLARKLRENLFFPVSLRQSRRRTARIFELVKKKQFTVSPMDVDEAILQMNLLEHDFFVFFNVGNRENCHYLPEKRREIRVNRTGDVII